MGAIVQPHSTSPLAVASLALGIVAIPFFWWAGSLGAAPAAAAFVTGLLAILHIARSRGVRNGRFLALAGMILAVLLAATFFAMLFLMQALVSQFIQHIIESIPTVS